MPRTDSEAASLLRSLPAIDALARWAGELGIPHAVATRVARQFVATLRTRVASGACDAAAFARALDAGARNAELLRLARQQQQVRHRRIVNATGVVLHTGLGRAPLADAAVEALVAAAGASVVEIDIASGKRDQREVAGAQLLCGLCRTEAALVVNNNAAAVILMLAALTEGREVVVSRGELVEIGGGFRMPDVMRRAGCTMVEVGTTNKTHLRDYTAATTAATAAWLKVHPSNFRIAGFTGVPPAAELVAHAAPRGVLVLDDLGSGLLFDGPIAGLDGEPRVADSVRSGVDVACFSGDKLLGGPQAGILIGRRAAIERCRAHPLYRALRCDKLTLAALEATLLLYRDDEPVTAIPTLRALAATPAELRRRSDELAAMLADLGADVADSESFAGSGANPARPLPSFAVRLRGGDELAARLRTATPLGVFARCADGMVWLDARTMLREDLGAVAAVVRQSLA